MPNKTKTETKIPATITVTMTIQEAHALNEALKTVPAEAMTHQVKWVGERIYKAWVECIQARAAA